MDSAAKQFIATLPRNFIGCFKGRMIVWHLIAIVLTYILVNSGFDWFYFRSTRSHTLWTLMFPGAVIGQLIPLLLPLTLLVIGNSSGNATTTRTAWAIAQAAFLGWFISCCYKSLTGRVHPEHTLGPDISHVFRFGFWRGGVFWGWPSSHTAVAFAMAVTLLTLFPRTRWLRIAAMTYAFYIGISVSMTIHWFSDFAAGAIIGSVIGVTVGKSFKLQNSDEQR